ncbi:hypothetical protein M8J76_010895 [Diaphorina citri]|nr:hypothetical protein M8J76_010895 [Diaphorina citri]
MEKSYAIDGRTVKYVMKPVTGDGACMFNMLSLALFGTEAHSLSIRREIVRHVVEYYEHYSAHIVFEHLGLIESPTRQQYEAYMSHPYHYGDFVELTAASAIFQRRIVTVRNDRVECDVGAREWGMIVTRFSGNTRGGHFDLCWPSGQLFYRHPKAYRAPPSRPPLTHLAVEMNIPMEQRAQFDAVVEFRGNDTTYEFEFPPLLPPIKAELSTSNPMGVGIYQTKGKGRPKVKKLGRPKRSEKSRSEQLREAADSYRKKHPEINRQSVARYSASNPEVNRKAVARYSASNPEVNRKAVARYSASNPEVNRKAVARYSASNPEVNRKAVARYSASNPEVNRKAVARYSASKPEVKKKSMSRYIFNKNNSFPRELEVIHKLTEKLKDRLEAEKLVKWVLQNRKIKIKYYLKLLDRLKSKLISNVQKLNSLSGSTTLEDKFKTLLGELHHCQTQEPYYYETSYQVLHTETTVVVNHEGEAMLNSNNGGSKVWACNFQICLLDELVLQNLLASFKYFIELTPAKLFTDLLDNQSPYARHLTTINSVKPHSPQLRTLSRLLYDLHFTSRTIHIIEDKLNSADVERLKELGDPTKIKGVSVEVDKEIDTTEDTIIERYKIAFKLLKKRSLDTPKNECMSCHRLLCLRDVSSINKLRNPPTTDTWKRLKFFYDCHKLSPSSFVCHNCLTKFRANEIPSHCILNDLFFNEVPEVIKSLNNFEKMLIQRAKAFQVVTSMIPVGNKHIPNRETIKKVKGRTFHLPLPLETTLKKLPNPEEPINRDQELYILVRSTATKNKIVWEDLVDVNKIYKALEYLKTHNNHYANIVLPHNPDLLLADLRDDLQHEVVVSSSIDNSTVDGEALLTQINEEEEQESTEQYTIYPLHEKRQNAPITALYQMLKVNAAPFDSRDSSIDVKCFPDLFVEGKFGQFHPRSVKLTSSEFIKCVLTSKHSRFRLNQQYLFFLLNDANIRQLNAGIFYKLNITNQNEKLTAQSYLEKLSNDDLEGDMQAVFSRLRNTEQYWKKPRSDVVCMTRHYGPATWFLTISPSEWMWSDLGHYIKSINGPDMANKSTSELVALDPVAASRFMDNHFKAMMDFITSPDAPLGIIEHYFWRHPHTTIRWIDINVNRNRRVKPKKAIHELDPTSTDIYFDSWVDTHYPQRPKDLDGMHLYDFVRWHDIVSSRPKSPLELFYELSSCKFLKKRQRPYLINHYMYDINKCPEKYYFSIILLFYPWRDLAELKAGKNTYTEAFDVLKQNIRDGIDYGNLQSDFVHSIEKAFELIEAKISEIELVNDHVAEDDGLENPLDFEPVEAINAMDDFRQVRDNISSSELDTLISKLNSDQLRVFQNVTLKLGENTSILRHFVSGTGGTGKSFLINTIKHWVATRLHKLVAVGAPTGIAAFNVNGLTIHRLLQLPVEHGNTLTYKPLSDQVIQVLRADLADVILLIIDEVSMISNVTLLFIHLRLTEIFDTGDQEDGWFGRIHLLLFGDLLQLPPVRQNPSYESLKPDETRKLIGSLSAPNLWNLLFTYDELTLNMRQKDDATFVDMLHRLRLGVVTKADQDLLSNRLIPISSGSNTNRLEEVTTYLHSLPDNTLGTSVFYMKSTRYTKRNTTKYTMSLTTHGPSSPELEV